ncbi:MAG TPA: hypothetical protein VGS41_05360, partial [Chthonomonadales bacterium]|nr:hypothetical protein [Chthonomonadales bacterium]
MNDEQIEFLKASVLGSGTFIRATFSGPPAGAAEAWTRVTMRPLAPAEDGRVQVCFFDEKKCITKNYSGEALEGQLERLIRAGFKSVYAESTLGRLRVTHSKRGRALVSIQRRVLERPPAAPHNRTKRYLLPQSGTDPWLQAAGIMDSHGEIRADKQRKYRQINEFLRLITETGALDRVP